MTNKSIQTVLVGLLVNVVLAAVKITAGILGNTYALIADGIESTLDVFSSLIIYSGIKIGSLPPDRDHPFGHGKAEGLAAMVVSAALIIAACVIAVESVQAIAHPKGSPAPFTLIVLIIVIFSKELLFRRLTAVGRHMHSLSVHVDAWHHRSDAITSLAALVGIALNLTQIPLFRSADCWAALIASTIIAFNGVNLLKSAVAEIMDAAPDPTIESVIRLAAMSVEGVLGIEKCKVRKSGTQYFVELHVEVNGQMTVDASHGLGHRVKDKLIKSPIPLADVVVHIEPKRSI